MFKMGIDILAGLFYLVILLLPVAVVAGVVYLAQMAGGTPLAIVVATVGFGIFLATKLLKLTHRISSR